MNKHVNLFLNNITIQPGYHNINYTQELIKWLEPSSIIIADNPNQRFNFSKNDVNIFFLVSFWLFKNKEYFRSIPGKKFIIEHDGFSNFLDNSKYKGVWTKFYKQVGFDLLLVSGKKTTEKFLNDGVPTARVPKGTDKAFLNKNNEGKGNLGYFGFSRGDIHRGGNSQNFPVFYKKRYEMTNLLGNMIDSIKTLPLDFP